MLVSGLHISFLANPYKPVRYTMTVTKPACSPLPSAPAVSRESSHSLRETNVPSMYCTDETWGRAAVTSRKSLSVTFIFLAGHMQRGYLWRDYVAHTPPIPVGQMLSYSSRLPHTHACLAQPLADTLGGYLSLRKTKWSGIIIQHAWFFSRPLYILFQWPVLLRSVGSADHRLVCMGA